MSKYNRPESFDDPVRLRATIDAMFGRDEQSLWQQLCNLCSLKHRDIYVCTSYAFKRLMEEGFTPDEINEVRIMLHKVVGGLLKRECNEDVKKIKSNLYGYLIPVYFKRFQFHLDRYEDEIYSQVMANLHIKFKHRVPTVEVDHDMGTICVTS